MQTLRRLFPRVFRRPAPVHRAPLPCAALYLPTHPFELEAGNVFAHLGAEVTVITVVPVFHGGRKVSVTVSTRDGRTLLFHSNSPKVAIVL